MLNMKYAFSFFAFFLLSCGDNASNSQLDQPDTVDQKVVELYGSTQGTTFSIICNDPISISMAEVNTILADFDLALSGYIPNSIVSQLNAAGGGVFSYEDKFNYFNRCYVMAAEVYELTEGHFDPTVYPLVDGWGFLKDIENVPDSLTVDSLKALVGFKNGYHFTFQTSTGEDGISVPQSKIIKNTPQAKLDFNAIAQGLAVDVLAEELEKRGAKNYFVEIGGEIRVNGLNSDGEQWRIGIDKPIEGSNQDSREIQEIVQLNNQSIATSGSYRKFYEKNGVKYSHTLDPKTGYPVSHSLLSVTVMSKSCAMADAMATALMVMGPEKSKAFIQAHPDLKIEVYLIYMNEYAEYETYYTPGFGERIVL